MKLAFYKGTKAENPNAKAFDMAVCWWTKGRFSHVELVVNGPNNAAVCISSSQRDGGVRRKVIDLTTDRWVIVDITADMGAALAWFKKNEGKGYDVPGLFGFVLPVTTHNPKLWFCSEACAEMLKLSQSWKYHPNGLYLYALNPANGLSPA